MHYKVLATSQELLPCADVGLNITSETISFGVIPNNCPTECYFILTSCLIFSLQGRQRSAATNGKGHLNPSRNNSPVVRQITDFYFLSRLQSICAYLSSCLIHFHVCLKYVMCTL